MANLSKIKRDKMIAYLESLKEKAKTDEEIIALNEIENSLRDKKFGLIFEEHTENVDELLKNNIPILVSDNEKRICKDDNLPWNFVIEGDNLQALYLLEKTHAGKVDCIYIDPPYNKEDSTTWAYDCNYVVPTDTYKHSKWLSMMKSRLLLAKRLLNKHDSVLIVTIDESEFLHLGCLLEEMFPSAKIQMISSVVNPTSVARANEFNRNNEYIFFVMIGDYKIVPFEESVFSQNNNGDVRWRGFRRTNAANLRNKTKTQFYPIYVNDKTHKIEKIGDPIPLEKDISEVECLPGCTTVFPIKDDGTEMMWGVDSNECKERLSHGFVRAIKPTPNKPQKYLVEYLLSGTIKNINEGKASVTGYLPDGSAIVVNNETTKVLPKTQWDYPSHGAREYGTKILDYIFHDKRFTFPKSLYAVRDTIRYFVSNKPNATIVDFFGGSATTLHAVQLLNKEDGGQRKCIIVTNNEVGVEKSRELKKQGLKQGDPDWAKWGVALHVTWPRVYCYTNGVDINGKPLKEKYLNTDIEMKEAFVSNIKYFKCDWIDRKPGDYLLSNALCVNIKQLLELQNHIEIDNLKHVLILNKNDFNKFKDRNLECVANLWINHNIVFSSEEMKFLKKYNFKYIPREFFGEELKEAGE